MINKVLVISRPLFLKNLKSDFYNTPEKKLVISVYGDEKYSRNPKTPENEKMVFSQGFVEWLPICFRDYSEKTENDINYEFNEIIANSIISFLNQFKDNVDTLVIHCDAGLSRSSAIGLWANRYLSLDEKEYLINNPRKCPNEKVLKILMDISGLTKSYEDFWKGFDK